MLTRALCVSYPHGLQEFRTIIVQWARELVQHTNIDSSGVVKFEFAGQQGKPILHNVVSGLTDELIAVLFHRMYFAFFFSSFCFSFFLPFWWVSFSFSLS
jgi:hypothetical protein